MGKVKGIFGTKISGKVGKVVFRTRGGENVVSEKPSEVKNPRSTAQQSQRMVLATVSAAYSALKGICDHSFEGVSNGSACMAEFMKRNINVMKSANQNFNLKGNGYILPNPLILSKGSLNRIPYEAVFTSDSSAALVAGYGVDLSGLSISTTSTDTFMSAFGLKAGDQLTIVAIGQVRNGDQVTSGYGPIQYQFGVELARLVLNPGVSDFTVSAGGTDENLVNFKNEAVNQEQSQNAIQLYYNKSTKQLFLNCPNFVEQTDENFACALIASSKDNNGKWMRSTQFLAVASIENDTNTSRANVLPSYNPSDPLYLNNAVKEVDTTE